MRFCTSSGEGRRPLVHSWITRSARSMSSSRSRRRWTRPRRRGIAVLAIDDLVADVQRAQLLEHLLLALLGLLLDPLPGRLLGALRPCGWPCRRPCPRSLRTCSMSSSRSRRRRSTLPKALTTTRVSAVSFSSVNSSSLTSTTSLTEMSPCAQLLAQLAEPLEGEVGGEDGVGDLVLALLDALGERDLALAREQGHAAHLAQVEADRDPRCGRRDRA